MRVTEQNRHSVQFGHRAHVRENHEIVLQSRDGVVIRMRADGISRYGRATQGVKVMNMREGDVVSAIARMVVSESGATDEEIDAVR